MAAVWRRYRTERVRAFAADATADLAADARELDADGTVTPQSSDLCG